MNKLVLFVPLTVSALGLGGCAPPGQGAVGYRDIDWPRADHLMNFSEQREIEILLGRLGYLQSGADGQITTTTRSAIRAYQRDIGAPVTGYVSMPLLNSLRVHAPLSSVQETTPQQPTSTTTTTTTIPRRITTPAATRASTTTTGGGSDGSGGSGGSGGPGGGSWN